jgi:diguanylate cyclase (GGDEF)-like protein
MISLRKAMETQVEEAFQSTLGSYRAALVAIGNAGVRACPPAGEHLQQSLLALQQQLTSEAPPELVVETEQRLEAELQTWGDEAARYYQEKTDEVKDILLVVAKAAGEVGERDQRYTKHFRQLTERLRATTQLNDLTAIRQSLTQSVADITTCVTKMAKDGQDSVAQLRAQVSTYETRLEEVERIAAVDALTGLFNRRKVEMHLERRIKEGLTFSVIYMDINDFKRINDTLGHLAGDDLLKQFTGELQAAFRATDIVGRWGGDEFIIVVDRNFHETKALLSRIDKWVNGEYTLTATTVPQKIEVVAAIGVATWQPGDAIDDVLRKADAAMYDEKARMKSLHTRSPV